MDFSYSEEQRLLQDSVRKFVAKDYDFEARGKIVASELGYSADHWATFAELGWLTVPFAEEDGGFGGRAVDLMVLMEAFGAAMVVEPYLPTAVLGGGLLAALGSAEQKAEWLPQVMAGKLQLGLAYAEADSRYNLASVKTVARPAGAEFAISGEKVLVFNGTAADQLLVVAREHGGERDRDGISVFMLPAETAGIARQGYPTIDGRRAAQVTFSEVAAGAGQRLGAAGKALPALERVIDMATLAVSAAALGALQSLLGKTVEYSKTRKQFGTAIGTFQALQHRMVDMFIECEQARSIVVRAAMTLDGNAADAEKAKAVSAAKSRLGRAIDKVGQEAIQIHGGIGMTEELDVGHLFKSVTALDILYGDGDYHARRFAAL